MIITLGRFQARLRLTISRHELFFDFYVPSESGEDVSSSIQFKEADDPLPHGSPTFGGYASASLLKASSPFTG